MRTFAATMILAGLLSATPAHAAPAVPPSMSPPGGSVAVWGILGYGNAIGFGARYRGSVVPEGFLHNPSVRDTLDVEGGLDFIDWYGYGVAPFDYGYNMFLPRVGVMWNFWLNPRVALYPKLDLGVAFGSYTGNFPPAGRHDFSGLFVEGSAGIIWRFRQTLSLRGELGSAGLRLGLGFDF
jgi:hypothetical protein